MADTITYKGIAFRRYPDAKQRTDRVYYTPNGTLRAQGVRRLHEEIWIDHNGPIPEGCHIHHKDGDPLNNAADNLEAVPVAEHMRHHHAGQCSPAKAEHLERIRPLTKEWHGSEEGLAWHREHARSTILLMQRHPHTCEHCRAEFEAVPKKSNRFCSNACKSAWRRASGVDDVDRTCAACGATFLVNRYSKKRACDGKCAWVLRRLAVRP